MQKEIIIKAEKPPIWDAVRNAFQINPKNVVFTYGNIIYNPDDVELPDHLIEHEKIHMIQQEQNGTNPALWWGKYLREPAFRVDQEAQAYAIQYLFICQIQKDRNRRARIMFDLAHFLSGPLYNHAINFDEAIKLIKKYVGEFKI